ncbi:NADP-dependent oxidoreductase [Chitinophaga ginsengisoli]|uniref:NADPH:quinone reductase-like Zn-dependent oxidoreductase n=1 Tax=Chitinophaga ginsengisoli TaxID=363837 RepID=A0A2P8FNJ2_9BACT|nr:NADP-dependent oxidoreductase [Chitinophaga ginsengisoli]PSL23291.1 NADPH:quinone reductase-like Zn-dependent oxidoreductase [Chitinophaga ginsengisoli]
MKAIEIHSFGGPEVLQLEEIPIPQIAADEALVRVYASGVNPVDYKLREGASKRPLPFIPGWDLSGVIEETGANVRNFKKGDAVYTRPDVKRDGTYAEYVAVKANELAYKPSSVDHVTAAAIPLAGLTAWQCLFEYGHLRAGQKVLIHGGSGGVGTFAIQFAKWKGAYVITTASQSNHNFLKELGADEVIDYHTPGYEDTISSVNLVLDTIGGDTQKRSLKFIMPGGTLVTTLKPEDNEPFEEKGIRLTGMYTQTRPEDLTAIAKLVDEGKVRPVIAKVLPLAQAATAQEMIEGHHVRGKIVLKVHDEDKEE